MNYYEHHLGDYVRDTAHLSILEDGAYRRLLDAYYIRETPLPVDQRECCKLARAASKPERAAVVYVLREFFELQADGHHQSRADAEIARFQDKSGKAKASAAKRWSKPDGSPDGPPNGERSDMPTHQRTHERTDMPTHSEGNAPRARPQSPDTNLHSSDASHPQRAPTALVAAGRNRRAPCPTDEIVSLYHEALPMLPRVEVLNDSRRRAISARWREVCTVDKLDRKAGLEWFAWFFRHVGASKFLTGRKPGKSGQTWLADFDFLMTPSKFARVVEGVYHKDAA